MTGGAGADTFTFLPTDPTLINSFTINDFSSLEGDKIDISAVLGDLTGSFIGTAAFTGTAGEVRVQNGFVPTVLIDLNGDRSTDFSIVASGGAALTSADFIL
jgi:hypothetical protein